MGRHSCKRWIAVGLAGVFSGLAAVVHAQQDCRITVFQKGEPVTPAVADGTLFYRLPAEEFSVVVTPASCAPSIGTLPDAKVKALLAQTPIVYSQRFAYAMAATEAESDVLVWWALGPVAQDGVAAPDPLTFDGRQYQALCAELGFCPSPQPVYSSGWPFKADIAAGATTATFRRLDMKQPLAAARGKAVHSVIYTLWRRLPSQYPMADHRELLFSPHFLTFVFQ